MKSTFSALRLTSGYRSVRVLITWYTIIRDGSFCAISLTAFSLFLMTMFSGCNRGPDTTQTDASLVVLEIKTLRGPGDNLKDIIEDVGFQRLEVTSGSLIREISSMTYINEEIFIINNRDPNGHYTELLRFNNRGDFLNQVGQRGRAPGEIIDPRDLVITDTVIDVWSGLKISRFTLDGVFIEDVFPAHFAGVGFIREGDNYLMYHGATPPHMFTKRNASGNIVESYHPYDRPFETITDGDGAIRYETGVSFYSSAYDTVYAYTEAGISPSVIFNYVDTESPFQASKRAKTVPDLISSQMGILKIWNFLENKDHIFIRYSMRRDFYYILYNKNENHAYYFTGSDKCSLRGISFNNKAPVVLTDCNGLGFPYSYQEVQDDPYLRSLQLPEGSDSEDFFLVMFRLRK